MCRRSSLCAPSTCRILIKAYEDRVWTFLTSPCPEWMRAMGYDTDHVRFSVECERWKRATARNGPHTEEGRKEIRLGDR